MALLKGLSVDQTDTNLPHLACVVITDEARRLLESRSLAALLEIGVPGVEFIRYTGAYGNELNIGYGFQLALIFGDFGPRLASDTVSKQMVELSKLILQEALHLCRTNNLGFDQIDIDELSKVAAVLGIQQNYNDLEVSHFTY